MRAALLFIGGIVLANIVWATFFWHAPAQDTGKPAAVVNSATRQGQDPWMVNERYNAPGRDSARKSALQTLDKPWSAFCTAEGHKLLIDTINHYYWQREAQVQSYGRTYGAAARAYAAKAWATPDDSRIERLIGETFGRGYFSLDDLRPYARTPLSGLVKGARSTARPCAA